MEWVVTEAKDDENVVMLKNLEVLQKKVNDVARQKVQNKASTSKKINKNREFKPPELDNNIEEFSKKKFAP